MPLWLQNLVVILGVLACVAFIARQALLSLKGRKSKLNGCGTCSSCGTTPASTQPKPAASSNRVAMIPLEMLSRKR
ncbi:MAG TPA: hypothetical protein VLJ39_18205 [Tepidisphaeraceae bacterium]|nr:hypothetical protein [Tepidisphaeraceae bacterium]